MSEEIRKKDFLYGPMFISRGSVCYSRHLLRKIVPKEH